MYAKLTPRESPSRAAEWGKGSTSYGLGKQKATRARLTWPIMEELNHCVEECSSHAGQVRPASADAAPSLPIQSRVRRPEGATCPAPERPA